MYMYIYSAEAALVLKSALAFEFGVLSDAGTVRWVGWCRNEMKSHVAGFRIALMLPISN